MLDALTLTLTSLPLFPLGAVLLPGGELSLNVFEVRYLDMAAKCHQTGAPFGVVTLTQGEEVRRLTPAPAAQGMGAPAFAVEAFSSVGTLAHIISLSRPRPGLLLLRCAGQQRFHITSRSQLKHGLWVADVDLMPADASMAIPPDLQHCAQALDQLIHKLAPTAVPTPYRLDDCAWVSNRWCELLPMPTELKQRLMALDSPLLRLELVSDILARTGITG